MIDTCRMFAPIWGSLVLICCGCTQFQSNYLRSHRASSAEGRDWDLNPSACRFTFLVLGLVAIKHDSAWPKRKKKSKCKPWSKGSFRSVRHDLQRNWTLPRLSRKCDIWILSLPVSRSWQERLWLPWLLAPWQHRPHPLDPDSLHSLDGWSCEPRPDWRAFCSFAFWPRMRRLGDFTTYLIKNAECWVRNIPGRSTCRVKWHWRQNAFCRLLLTNLRDLSHAWAEGSASAASRGPSLRQIQTGASVDGGDAFQCWLPWKAFNESLLHHRISSILYFFDVSSSLPCNDPKVSLWKKREMMVSDGMGQHSEFLGAYHSFPDGLGIAGLFKGARCDAS